jgi:hypothetical protein
MIRAEVRVSLDHGLRLPPSGSLHRVEVHASHGEPAGERVAEGMEAEVWNLSG